MSPDTVADLTLFRIPDQKTILADCAGMFETADPSHQTILKDLGSQLQQWGEAYADPLSERLGGYVAQK